MNRALLRIELTRLRRDPVLALIVVVLPVFLYVGFTLVVPDDVAAGPDSALRLRLLTGLAGYGAATGASNLAGQAALERVHGWSRQLAMTPLRTRAYLGTKAVVSILAAAVSVSVTFTIAAASGARASAAGWVLAWLVLVLGAGMWALFGLLVGLAFRSESALAASAAALVLLGFAAGMFVPLPAEVVGFVRWTPMFGYAELGRAALLTGSAHPVSGTDVLWAVVNVGVWSVLLAIGAGRLLSRARSRG